MACSGIQSSHQFTVDIFRVAIERVVGHDVILPITPSRVGSAGVIILLVVIVTFTG